MRATPRSDSTQDKYNSVKGRDVIGYVGIGVGAAATGLGLFFLLTGDNPNKYDKKPTPDVSARSRRSSP